MKTLTRNEWIAVIVSLVFVAFLLYGGSLLEVFGGVNQDQSNNNNMSQLPESGFKIEDLQTGSGETARAGDRVTVHYVGTLPSGKVFDSSLDRQDPFIFTLGAGDVIRGWDEGLVGMQVGGIRRLLIAPNYGYGSRANGPIPANSPLIFEVQLLDVERAQ